jgi:hypothetical protein
MILGDPVDVYLFKSRSVYFGHKRWSRGVTKVIQKVFCPSFVFKKIKRGSYVPGLTKRKAKKRGHLVDQIIENWVLGKPTRCRILEPRSIINIMEELEWVPIASQLVVAWPEARLATKIDLVVYCETTNKIIVVEIKTGCGYRRCSTPNGFLHHLRPKVSNAPIHQHQLQIILGKELLARTYPNWSRNNIEAVLIYVSTDGELELIREHEFSFTYSTIVENILLNTAAKK